eukprot:s3603_g8.t1
MGTFRDIDLCCISCGFSGRNEGDLLAFSADLEDLEGSAVEAVRAKVEEMWRMIDAEKQKEIEDKRQARFAAGMLKPMGWAELQDLEKAPGEGGNCHGKYPWPFKKLEVEGIVLRQVSSSSEELADSDIFEGREIHLALLELCPVDDETNSNMLLAIETGDCKGLEELLRRPCKPNMADGPLHVAIKMGHVEALQLLLEAFADAEAQDLNGLKPLHCAARNGESESVQLLLKAGADKEARDTNGATPLHAAAAVGDAESMH